MTAADLIAGCAAARGLAERVASLGRARDALDAYAAALGADERAVEAARAALQRANAGLHFPAARPDAPAVWIPPASSGEAGPGPSPPPPPPHGRELEPASELFRRLVNTNRVLWDLGALCGTLNRIATNPLQLLGEAVVLLPPAAFACTPNEDASEYADRLRAWAMAVEEYTDHLRTELHARQAEAPGLEGVLALWLAREAGRPDGWERFIADRRARLRTELDDLRRKLDAPRAPAGGSP